MTTNSDMLRNVTDTRIALLETSKIAQRFSSEANIVSQGLDRVFAQVENRVIQYILMSRMRKAFATSGSVDAAAELARKTRNAYEEGNMETLPSFLPSRSSVETIAADSTNTQSHISNQRPIILYIPGGGFIVPPSKRQKLMIQRLSEATRCETVLGVHRLAPENPFPIAAEDIANRYKGLLEKGIPASSIFLAADTAGASVGLGAIQLLQKSQKPLPAGIILFSPWCDLSLSGWSYITRGATSQSPFTMETAAFCARLYLQEQSATLPLASPIFANLKGWPPILIHTSENDLHFDDAIKLAENGQQHGCDVKLNYWDSARHHLERLSSKDAERSFQKVSSFIENNWSRDAAE